MATLQIEEGLWTEFMSDVDKKIQQKTAKLKPYVDIVPINSEYKVDYDFGTIEFTKNNNAFATIDTDDEIAVGSRRFSSDRYLCALKQDMNILKDTKLVERWLGDAAEEIANGSFRQVDRLIISGLLADMQDKDGTAITFAADGGIVVDAISGVTFSQFDSAREQLMAKGFMTDDDTGLLFICSEKERLALERQVELSSADFMNSFGVVKDPTTGNLTRLRGVEILTYASSPMGNQTAILPVAAGVRSNFFMNIGRKKALTLGIQKDYSFKVVELDQRYFDTMSLQGEMKMGIKRNANPGIVHFKSSTT